MSDSTAVAVVDRAPPSAQAVSVFHSMASFEGAQRMARALCNSPMVPANYRGDENMGSALIALDIAQRIDANPLMVMQNLHIIGGRPSWGASFIIAALNACGKFTPLRFKVEDRGEAEATFTEWSGPKGNRTSTRKTLKLKDKSCVAWCIEKATGERLEGPEVSLKMAVAEGWYTKSDSKWPTMTDLMLRYRAAAFFGRLYAPDLLMGMQTADELNDIDDVEYVEVKTAAAPAPAAASEPDKPRRARGVAAAMADKAAPAAEEAKPEPVKVSSGKAAAAKSDPKPAAAAAESKDPPHDPETGEVYSDMRDGRADYGEDDGENYGAGDVDEGDYAEQSGDSI